MSSQKERDLELAARIGQSLLKKNRTLTEQNDYLEEQVGQITEEVLIEKQSWVNICLMKTNTFMFEFSGCPVTS